MQSKTSSFNRGMWIQSMRNVGWIGALYTLVLLFILPLQIILRYTGEVNENGMYTEKLKTLFEVVGSLQFLFMFTVPVVLAIFLFRYIQTKSAADYIHSLPISILAKRIIRNCIISFTCYYFSHRSFSY
ncbi:hypothetical protein [Priestia megaterium]|uniref:hypothetical protein n=1 Tax=Priestia megaterium TaxID=1404 RepID=UPI002FFF8A48